MEHPLAAAFETQIMNHRLLPIESPWADEIVFPYYEGLSIRNLAHTAIRLLDGKPSTARLGSSPLDGRLWEPLWGQAKRVVLFISDGMGWRLLQEIVASDPEAAQIVADLTGNGTLTPITSITPSTTAAALPCIWTGSGPIGNGMTGTRLFLREFSVLADMLHYSPMNGRHRSDVLEEWGLDFSTFIPVSTLGEELAARHIESYALLQKDLFGSGLSKLMHRGITGAVKHYGYTDLWVTLRDLLRETRGKRCFINVYWSGVDGSSHLYGTVTEQSVTEIRRQLADLRDVLLADGISDGHTLMMLVADHGHSAVKNVIDLTAHPVLLDMLRCGLGGDSRLTHLYLRDGMRDAAMAYVREHFADSVVALDTSDAIRAGLFGPDPCYPEAAARLGDVTLIAREGTIVSTKASPGSLSRHAGMSAREMLVPLMMQLV
ncbi:MAG TPA: alkaline phosphatase family protein [Aggregatilinea sp.]|uniref:alkaline phosphatase family protein n=1 Tax=Aggregatilinea sp. TaxID=2806333 RepID=UPI002BBE6987|nr:alkaline phosphatase family protein [Aggregatilinea sp.]HML23204.1 alkaline phosphatase family protein [Aggregatilinea sp.]